ncbi:MAG: tetratricopeptide repeat protein [Planctomycetota bacterium]|nr:tetratricopeptide repeat protein [Planctomycetota bacterium]
MKSKQTMIASTLSALLVLLSGMLAGWAVQAGEAPPPKETPRPAPKEEAQPLLPTKAQPAPEAPRPATKTAPLPAGPTAVPRPPAVPETPADIRDMTNPRYLLELAQVHSRFNALDRAEELLRKAQPLEKEQEVRAQIALAMSTLLQRKQDYKGATASLEEAVSLFQNATMRSQYTMVLADLYSQQQDYAKAEKTLSDLAEAISGAKARPEDAWLLNQRLVSLWQRQEGKIEKMTAAAEEALAKDPQNTAALERLASLYSAGARDPAKAVAVYEKLVQQKPNDPNILNRLASAYQEAKQYDKAIEVHQKLLASDPNGRGQSSVYQIAQLLLQSGKKDEAVKWAKEKMTGDSKSPYGVLTLANIYEKAGMLAEAEDGYRKMRELAQDPQQKAEYTLRIADFARQQKNYKKAEEELQQLLKQDFPENRGFAMRANAMLAQVMREQGVTAQPPVQPPAPPPAPPKKAE